MMVSLDQDVGMKVDLDEPYRLFMSAGAMNIPACVMVGLDERSR